MGLFTQTKRFTAAVELINGLETKPLSKILGRILSALPEKKVRTIVRGEHCAARALWATPHPSIQRSVRSCAHI